MMKCEFEEMIGKEVDYETFEMYERMYSVLPERITKQQFVEMLNIDNIPESAASLQRKKEREELVADYKAKIKDLRDNIEYEERQIAVYRQWLKRANGSKEDKAMYRRSIRCRQRYINRYKATICEYRSIIE